MDIYALGSGIMDIEFMVQTEQVGDLGMSPGSMVMAEVHQQQERIAALRKLGLQPQMHCGGSAVNSLVTAVAMGASGGLSTRLAADDDGRSFMQDLHACGIACDNPLQHEGVTGTCVVLLTPDAERSMSTHLGVSAQFGEHDIDRTLLAGASWVYVEGYLVFVEGMAATLCEVGTLAQQGGGRLAMSLSDPSVAQHGRDALLNVLQTGTVSLLFGNAEEFMLLTGADAPAGAEQWMREKYPSTQLVITLGGEGVRVADSAGGSVYLRGEPVRATDTLGAGDCFAGAFLYALTRGADMQRAAHYANTCAAVLVQMPGPRLPLEQCRRLAQQGV